MLLLARSRSPNQAPRRSRLARSAQQHPARVLIAAHPDDGTRLLAYLANVRHVPGPRTSMTRGGGGQNLIRRAGRCST
jgi:hypothetical protein